VHTFRQMGLELKKHGREVRTLVLARGIPTVKVGNAYAVDEKGFNALKRAFTEIDREAEARGMVTTAAN